MPILPARPMSNYERQVAFRKRNPGYYGRLHRRRRAAQKVAGVAMEMAQAAATAPASPTALPAPKPVLMLPAPVENPLIAEINAIKARLASAEPLMVPIRRSSAA
jgi:hypothetical protein